MHTQQVMNSTTSPPASEGSSDLHSVRSDLHKCFTVHMLVTAWSRHSIWLQAAQVLQVLEHFTEVCPQSGL